MKEERCDLICSLCGRELIEYTTGNWACLCEEEKAGKTVPMRIYTARPSVGCPACLSSQLVLPILNSGLFQESTVICYNSDCPLYSIHKKKDGTFTLLFRNKYLCGFGIAYNKIIFFNPYSELINKFFEQVIHNCI